MSGTRDPGLVGRQRVGNDAVDRYRPTRPIGDAPTPATRRPAVRGEVDASRLRNSGNAPRLTERYRPRDTTAPSGAALQPRSRSGAAGSIPSLQPRPRVSTLGAGPTPQLVPRTAAPRLTMPRPAPLTATVRARNGYFGSCYQWNRPRWHVGSIWGGFWNPCSYGSPWSYGWSSWGWGANWGWGGDCGWTWGLGIGLNLGFPYYNPFCWNVGAAAPYWAYRSAYWGWGYQNCWWNTWSQPYGVSTGYWWYPSTTYCPVYLSVPSSVVVVDDVVAADPAPTDAPATEVVVAGGGVVGSARAIESHGAESDAAGPDALATKYVELGDLYFRSGRYQEAAEAYARARGHAPKDASVHFVLADAAFANGDYHYAAFLIAEAVRLEPAIVTAVADKRAFYGDAKDFDAQLEALQRYCGDKPYDAWAQLVLGYNLAFSDRPTSAIAAFRRVLELDPGNPTARTFLDALAAG